MKRKSIMSHLRAGKVLVVPGVYDALSARLAEQAGFEAIFDTGYGTAASLLGYPDFGMLNAGERVEHARTIAQAVSIPLIVDGDTGYGNALNVRRLVRDLEAVGAAGVLLEDQVWPKRCGHMPGKQVISMEEHIQKLRAAIEARESEEFAIFARTDARAPLGLEEAIRRGQAYREAGADVIFVEAPRSVDELRTIASSIEAPTMANMLEGGLTPLLSAKELSELGIQVILFPLSTLYAAAYGVREVLKTLKAHGTTKPFEDRMIPFNEFNRVMDLPAFLELEQRYAVE